MRKILFIKIEQSGGFIKLTLAWQQQYQDNRFSINIKSFLSENGLARK